MTRFLLLLALLIVMAMVAQRLVERALQSPLARQIGALWRSLAGARQVHDRRRPSGSGTTPARRDLVRCTGCGVYVPEARARRSGRHVLCPGCASGDAG